MTEILTESFCERCGTRYTFESAAPRRSRIGRVRVVSRGLKNFVMQDESTFSEAMADARSEEEQSATAHQLDAFHKTFNFCLTCRQYTCANCWNTTEGRCLTCSPIEGQELPEPGAAVMVAAAEAAAEPLDGDPDTWPEADLGKDRLARVLGLEALTDESAPDWPAAEPAALVDAVDEVDEVAAAGDEPVAALEVEATATGEAPMAAAEAVVDEAPAPPETVRHVRGLAPGQSLEEAVAEYEMAIAAEEDAELEAEAALGVTDLDGDALATDWPAAAAAAVEPEGVEGPAEAAKPEPAHDLTEIAGGLAAAAIAGAIVEHEREPEPEPVADAPENEPEPVAAAPEPEPEPEPVAVAPEPEPEPEPIAAAPEPEPEPVAAAPEPEPEPIAAAPEPEPEPIAVAPEPEPEPVAAREDVIAQPVWPVAAAPVAPEAPATPAPEQVATPDANPWLTVAPDEAQPQWPAAPQWGRVAQRGDLPTTLAGHALMPQDDAAALWAASAREVLGQGPRPAVPMAPAPVTPRPCVSCGLSLSANARFCRRCGSRQA